MQGVKIVTAGIAKLLGNIERDAGAFEEKVNAEIKKLNLEGKKVLNVSSSYDRGLTYLASILWETE